MKNLIALTLSLIVTTAVAAQTPRPAPPRPALRPAATRTVVIRDGKVISGGELPELMELGGKRAHLGVSLVDLTPDLRSYYGA